MNTQTPLRRSGRRALFTVNILLLSFAALHAQNSTYSFLLNDVGARSAAMAGSFVSMRDDVNSIFYNPAGLATVTRPQASFGYLKNLLDINSGYLSYAQNLSDVGKIGLGIDYVNYGTFDETDELANKIGTFSAGDLDVSVGFATEFEDNLYYGFTGKFIYSSIADASSSAIAADFGILYFIPGPNPVTIGASILNVGTQLNPYMTTRESLPLDLKIGASIKPEHLPLLLNVDLHELNETQDNFGAHFKMFSIGGEFTMSKELRFRFGYDNERHQDLTLGTSSGLAGFSFGGGLVLETLRFDYAFTSLGKIGSLNTITVEMNL
ncbi:MAG: type IX secretion system protein PorQ [Bacteroidota bacterium]